MKEPEPYVILYTQENGRREFTKVEWDNFSANKISFHRVDGPAVEYLSKRIEQEPRAWWIEDKRYSEKDYNQLIQEVKDMPEVLRLVDPRKWVREFK